MARKNWLHLLFPNRLTGKSELVAHAERELRLAGFFDKSSDYDGALGPAVLEMVEKLAEQGHSGASVGLTVSAFIKVANFEPLTPLTGEDSEWVDHGEGLFQNKRCGRVFKDETGAYDIDGVVFREPSGACFTNRNSRVRVTFPYTPHTDYVDIGVAA